MFIKFALVLALVLVLAFVWRIIFVIIRTDEPRRPIVCVCRVNDRVGIVLRRDYDTASRRHWKQYYGGKHYDAGHVDAPSGCSLEVENVFVFKAWSREFLTLCYDCYVERANFYVPNRPSQIAEAYQHFHGKPWDGRFINW